MKKHLLIKKSKINEEQITDDGMCELRNMRWGIVKEGSYDAILL
jgi:hypothetical protein